MTRHAWVDGGGWHSDDAPAVMADAAMDASGALHLVALAGTGLTYLTNRGGACVCIMRKSVWIFSNRQSPYVDNCPPTAVSHSGMGQNGRSVTSTGQTVAGE